MSKQQPNVIIFFTDQQRADTTGVHGNPMGITDNFDRMAITGTHCYNGFTCQPVCVPARLSLQTGNYASHYGSYNNGVGLPLGTPTLGHYFQDAGYHTGYIGKWHLAKENPVPTECRTGYDYWLGGNAVESFSDAYASHLYDNDGNRVDMPGYRADSYADAAIKFIDKNRDKPFFLMTSWLEPHFQNTSDDFPAPEGYEEKYAKNCWTPPDLQTIDGTAPRHLPGYYGMVKRLDECLGRIRDTLRSLDLLDNTIIVFTSDHGCHFKTRNREYKRSCHDSSTRIPLAFSGPGFDQGGRLNEMISLVDVPPTLLDACNISVPETMQGRSILPLINRDQTAKENWPEEVLIEFCDNPFIGRVVRTHRWTYSVKRTVAGNDVSKDWEFTEEYLYDNQADPWQLDNLINNQSFIKVKKVMRERLLKRMAETGEPKPQIIIVESSQKSGQRLFAEKAMYM
ncbi:MAG: sulfatase-like hydrolase/transferase [Victivallaceae bacterium]|nr:sulfatase-like hydrolase/transferase [Victivallaceae bacterium]